MSLGAVLLQENQPCPFTLRALTDAETRYVQIEKELLAIMADDIEVTIHTLIY